MTRRRKPSRGQAPNPPNRREEDEGTPGDSAARVAKSMLDPNVVWLWTAIVASALLGWITRDQLSPDGVAYLDVADRLRAGDWRGFVQGYWSPLFPLILAGVTSVTSAIWALHALQGLTVVLGGLVLYRGIREARAEPGIAAAGDIWVHAIWVAYILCGVGLVRLSAVTPDLLLLVALTGVVRELLLRPTPRWLNLGLWLGMAFLAKTSVWPWLLVALAYLGWRYAPLRSPRPLVYLLAPVALLVAAWVVPLSIRYGGFTVGSTGTLNACWYLRFCDGRSPDTHAGAHRAYATTTTPKGQVLQYASFEGVPGTYAPWSDPTAWRQGVQTQRDVPLTIDVLVGIVRENLLGLFIFTLSFLYIGPVAAMAMHRAWGADRVRAALARPRIDVALLGAVGLAQFVAVHVEPRLTGTFAFLHVAGLIIPRWPAKETLGVEPSGAPHPWVLPVSMLTLVATLSGVLIREANYEYTLSVGTVIFRNEITKAVTDGGGFKSRTVVAVGNAFTLMGTVRALGARIVGQVPPPTAEYLGTIAPSDRQALLYELSKGRADLALELRSDGRTLITRLR